MKRFGKSLRNGVKIGVTCLAVVIMFSGCNKSVTGVTLDKTTLTLCVGDTAILTAAIQPADAGERGLSWSSSNNDAATVWNGTITAKAMGTTTITVTTSDGNKTATCIVTVRHPAEPEMVFVEGGTFMMGADDDKNGEQVTVSSFYIAKYEVTQKQWVSVMGDNPSYYRGNDNLPVDGVNWNYAQQFIFKLNQATGKNYRLPTNAEWEYAACGGNKSKGYKYSGSNNIDEVAWYNKNSGWQTHPVGSKAANELGIYDMSGNLSEWCDGWFINSEEGRPCRGGNWDWGAEDCRVSYGVGIPPNIWASEFGFRLVLDE